MENQNQNPTTTNPEKKAEGKSPILGNKPCPICGCPYYNDHVPNCPGVIIMPIVERIDALEAKLKHQGIIQ